MLCRVPWQRASVVDPCLGSPYFSRDAGIVRQLKEAQGAHAGARKLGIAHHVGLYLHADVGCAFVVAVLGATPLFSVLASWAAERTRTGAAAIVVRGSVLVGVCTLLLLVGMSLAAGTHNPFIYFRF